jgi:hypothetical protein
VAAERVKTGATPPGGLDRGPRRGARVRHGLVDYEGTGRYDGPITHWKLEAGPGAGL